MGKLPRDAKLVLAQMVSERMDQITNLEGAEVTTSHPTRLETMLRIQTPGGPRYFLVKVQEKY